MMNDDDDGDDDDGGGNDDGRYDCALVGRRRRLLGLCT